MNRNAGMNRGVGMHHHSYSNRNAFANRNAYMNRTARHPGQSWGQRPGGGMRANQHSTLNQRKPSTVKSANRFTDRRSTSGNQGNWAFGNGAGQRSINQREIHHEPKTQADAATQPDADALTSAAIPVVIYPAEAAYVPETVPQGQPSQVVYQEVPVPVYVEPNPPATEDVDQDVEESNEPQSLRIGPIAMQRPADTKPVMFIDMTIHRDGDIEGTYLHAPTNRLRPISGKFDDHTQIVTWTIGDNKNFRCETPIDNLTKDEADMWVRYGAERTEKWKLVRLAN